MQRVLGWFRSCGLEPLVFDFLNTNTGNSNPYHSMAHGLRVGALAGQAMASHTLPDVEAFGSVTESNLVRTATVAGLFHDWGHPGKGGTDDKENVERAAQKVMQLEDGQYGFTGTMAAAAILDTAFPYEGDPVEALGGLLRDADIWHMADLTEEEFLEAQAGLAAELGVPLAEWIAGNATFLSDVMAWTPWGKDKAMGNRERMVAWCKRWGVKLGG